MNSANAFSYHQNVYGVDNKPQAFYAVDMLWLCVAHSVATRSVPIVFNK